jgi:hypothetical protein
MNFMFALFAAVWRVPDDDEHDGQQQHSHADGSYSSEHGDATDTEIGPGRR